MTHPGTRYTAPEPAGSSGSTGSGPTSGPRRRASLIKSVAIGEALRETRAAVFLDRDGTIIRDTGYVRRPEEVELMPGAALAIRIANNRQFPVIVVTNQSGIARGMFSEHEYDAVRRRVTSLLGEAGAFVDAEYHCPHHPDFTGPCDCRKPGIALFERAATEQGVDPAASAFIGDRWRDIEPARHYGARGILVPSEATPPEEVARAQSEMLVIPSLIAAVEAAVGK
ncbi:MAG: HAD family hydrolase [Gemmatimonadaceae bacterium]|nr:HAD family hydrolase [Gemmatimonadaceae bacterium]